MRRISRRITALCLALVMALAICITVGEPAEAATAKSPYNMISSGDYTDGNGVGYESYSATFKGLYKVDDGDWAKYAGYNFSSGAKQFTVRYKKDTASSAATVCLKVRVGSPTGKIIASVNLSTKTGKSWETKEATVNEYGQTLIGTYDVYLTFVVGKGIEEHIGDATPRLDIGKFQFTKKTGGVVNSSQAKSSITSTAFKEWDEYGEPVHLLKWSSASGVTGYELAACEKSNFSSKVYKGQFTGTSCNLYLAQGQVWYVRVRTYKKSGSLTVYSNWSNTVKVTGKTGHAVG